MRNLYDKYIRMEHITLGLAVLTGIFAVIQGYAILMVCSLYMIAFSIFCDGVIYASTNNTAAGIKQFMKAGMVLLLSTILLFQVG
ncbi:hypothetical protein EU245_12950 [Lentibacillus lipolyticus]|nr:hypothetical protein EU245_12950 [Lentibacillus lipolyticus]